MSERELTRLLIAVGVGALIMYVVNRRSASAITAPAAGSPQLPAGSSNPLLQSMDQAVLNLATGVSEL